MQTLQNVYVFLILSYSNIYARDQVLPKHFLGTSMLWRLRMKQDNWVTMTYLRHVAVVTARDG